MSWDEFNTNMTTYSEISIPIRGLSVIGNNAVMAEPLRHRPYLGVIGTEKKQPATTIRHAWVVESYQTNRKLEGARHFGVETMANVSVCLKMIGFGEDVSEMLIFEVEGMMGAKWS